MPTYDYKCNNCGEFEFQQSIKEDAVTVCPKCGGTEIKRLISRGAGIIFKGSGFYETDYKRKENNLKEGAKAEPAEKCSNCEHSKEGTCGR
jgi:putative FmdB family regulatory protein